MILFSFLAAVLLHECGHLTALFVFRARLISFRLSCFGMTIRHTPLPSTLADVTVALAGPMFGLLGYFVSHSSIALQTFSILSLVLSLFNLLPITALDGGNAVKALAERLFSPYLATYITSTLSRITLLILWLGGAYIFFILDQSPSLFLLSLMLFFEKLRSETTHVKLR